MITILKGCATELEIAAIEKALALREASGVKPVIEGTDGNSR